jgi:hypothetical protein
MLPDEIMAQVWLRPHRIPSFRFDSHFVDGITAAPLLTHLANSPEQNILIRAGHEIASSTRNPTMPLVQHTLTRASSQLPLLAAPKLIAIPVGLYRAFPQPDGAREACSVLWGRPNLEPTGEQPTVP